MSEVAFQATTSVQGNFDNVEVQADTNYVFSNAFISANTGLTGGGTVITRFMKEDIGLKIYEYTNHLGNVLLTTNDKRLRIDNNSDNLIDSYLADDLSKSDYYPYGMAMVGRNSNISDYRFGMNGMEMDNELSGTGNSYTAYFRQYDPRLGMWLSIDPVFHAYQSPYASFNGNPIYFVDPSGAEGTPSGGGSASKVPDGYTAHTPTADDTKIASGTADMGDLGMGVDIIAEKPTLGKMITTRLQMVGAALDALAESLKGGIGDKAPAMASMAWGEMDQGGEFPKYKDDRHVKTNDGLELIENIAFAYEQMGYQKMNWRDQAKKHVKDSKELKQLEKAMGKLNDIRKGYQNGNYAQATDKLLDWYKSDGGKLVIKVAQDFADSPEANNTEPVLNQPSAEEVQQFFEENFEVINNRATIKFDAEGDSATHTYGLGVDSVGEQRVTREQGEVLRRRGAKEIK